VGTKLHVVSDKVLASLASIVMKVDRHQALYHPTTKSRHHDLSNRKHKYSYLL